MSIPAIHYNAHYLFEDGVLEFDRPVEIHVSRFSNNQKIVDRDWVSSYPKYDIPFDSQDSHKVLITSNEPISSPNRENTEVVIANHEQYDLILTSDDEILRNCPNASIFPYGTTWLNKGHINHPDGLGIYDESLDELCNNKRVEVSFLCSAPNRGIEGYDIRRSLWHNRNKIKIPKCFYSSTRNPAPGGEPLPEDDKKYLFNSQFHIVIESSCINNYFTEKLIDAFLTKTVPIYWGCPNIHKFFDPRGMIICEGEQGILNACNGFVNENHYQHLMPFIETNYNIAKEYAQSFAKRVKDKIENSFEGIAYKNSKLLSIGICSLNERKETLDSVLKRFQVQMNTKELNKKIEIIVNVDDGQKSVGQKRNEILDAAVGKFVCFVDDDDAVDDSYIEEIINTIENNADLDCIGFSGMYYVDGDARMLFKHANSYGGHYKDSSGVQHRPVNHLNPVRTEIAKKCRFPEKNFGEDSDYCDRLFDSGLLKKEVILDTVMYHYYYSEQVTKTQKNITTQEDINKDLEAIRTRDDG